MQSWKEETPAEYINISHISFYLSPLDFQVAKGQRFPPSPGDFWKETASFPKCESFQERARGPEQQEGKRQRIRCVSLPLPSQQL